MGNRARDKLPYSRTSRCHLVAPLGTKKREGLYLPAGTLVVFTPVYISYTAVCGQSGEARSQAHDPISYECGNRRQLAGGVISSLEVAALLKF